LLIPSPSHIEVERDVHQTEAFGQADVELEMVLAGDDLHILQVHVRITVAVTEQVQVARAEDFEERLLNRGLRRRGEGTEPVEDVLPEIFDKLRGRNQLVADQGKTGIEHLVIQGILQKGQQEVE
jgi:hypothetical protein